MLRLPAIIVAVLSLSLVTACTPVAEKLSPTPAPATSAPKSAASPTSAATPQPPAAPTAAPKSAPPPTLAATPQPAVEKPQKGGKLVYLFSGEWGELDPHLTTVGVTRRVSRLMYNTLVSTDKDGNLVPELAESWSYPDPKTVVFKLRKGVKFHDGTDFNAQAVKFNIERVQTDPRVKAFVREYVTNVRSVEVIDEYTVKFNLETPEASLLGNLTIAYTGSMVSPAAVKKLGDDTLSRPAGMGTGPFEFVEWVKGDHLTMKRFDGYWRKDEYGDPLPYLDQVTIKPIPDQSVMLANVRTANADLITEVLPAQLPSVEGDRNLKTSRYGDDSYRVALNLSEPPFNNKALRQAVSWAIDREAIHEAIYAGIGAAEKYILAQQSWAFDTTGKFYTKDNAKARAALAEGGKPDGFKFTAKSYPQPLQLRVAQAMKGQLAEVGIDMDIIPVEERQLAADRVASKFQAIFSQGGTLAADPDAMLYKYLYSKSESNWVKYNNPEADKLMVAGRTTFDQAERKAIYAKLQALIVDDSVFITVHEGPLTAVMRQNVMGFAPNIDIYSIQLDWVWLKR